MKKIIVSYWNQHNLIPNLEHNCEFEYSIEKQNEIVQIIIEHGLTAILRPNMKTEEDTLLIYIVKGRLK